MRKKDGSWRICVDYRRVNAATLLNQYPLARIDDVFARMARLGVRFGSMFQSLLIADELTKDLSSFKACGRWYEHFRVSSWLHKCCRRFISSERFVYISIRNNACDGLFVYVRPKRNFIYRVQQPVVV